MRFNEKVEGDILYYSTEQASHFVDRATKWHAGMPIESHEETHLLDMLWTIWIGVHGPQRRYTSTEKEVLRPIT